MLRGDFGTMPLPDLLQWVDMARRDVVVEIERPVGDRPWLATRDRAVVAASVPRTGGALVHGGTSEAPGPQLQALCVEGILDLFFENHGTFVVTEVTPKGGAALDVPLGFLIMEGLRQLDDWPRLDTTYPDERARVVRTGNAQHGELGVVQSEILTVLETPRTIAETRIVLGLSHRALLRRLDELVSMRLLRVEGSVGAERTDLSMTLAEQARALLREQQFAEAAHVLRSLLAARPDDTTLLRLLEEAERQHVAACRAQLSRSDLVRLVSPDRGKLSPTESVIVEAIAPKPRSVAGLVLVSPMRELETLTAILRLRKRGVVEVSSV